MSEAEKNVLPEESAKQGKKKEKKSLGREIMEWILTLGAAALIALCIRTFIFEPVHQ